MKPSEAPEGSVAYVGHPGNRILVVKTSFGSWRYVDSGRIVGADGFRAGWDFYIPAEEAADV